MTAVGSYDLFVSYADADRAWVEGYLIDALEAAGVRCHSEAAFALGVPRVLEFERAVQQSQRTLIILSQAYLADNFSQFADLLVQTYGLESGTWPVIPLILEPVTLPLRLSLLPPLDVTDSAGRSEAIARLCAALQRPLPPDPPKPPCPFPGMVQFGEADSARFFGREQEVQDLLERLRFASLLTVIGPSGSGKSSLVFAGLLPALRKSGLFGVGTWLVQSMRPGSAPNQALASLLHGDLDQLGPAVAALLEQAGAARLLLIVDQFEETYGRWTRGHGISASAAPIARNSECLRAFDGARRLLPRINDLAAMVDRSDAADGSGAAGRKWVAPSDRSIRRAGGCVCRGGAGRAAGGRRRRRAMRRAAAPRNAGVAVGAAGTPLPAAACL